jgi:acetolactate synthase-1/2/3 large subunit
MEIAAEEKITLAEPQVTETVSGSIALLEGLIAEGTEIVFGYPGGAIMPIYDALYDYKEKSYPGSP